MGMNFVRVFINLFQFNRTNWKAVVLCLLAAAIFWIFNAFNKNHSSTIRFPLHFEYDSQRFAEVTPLPHHISINVSGSGWDLVRKSLGIKLPDLAIPLERPLETRKILTSSLTHIVSSQLGGLQINYMVTDTLRIHLDEKTSKTFKLSIDLSKIKFREGFVNTGVIDIRPDSLVIDGPKTIVNSLPDTIVLPVNGTQVSKSFQDEIEVPLFNSVSITRNPSVVRIKVEVGPVEMIETKIKVRVVNQPRRLKSFFTDSVKVLIQIPAAQSGDLRSRLSQVNAILDLKNTVKGSYQIYPSLAGLPIYARVVSIDSVSFKIDKPN